MTATLIITDVKVHGLPNVGWGKRPGKCYLILTIGNVTTKTKVAARGNSASWDEAFHFNIEHSSTLEIRLYAHHTAGPDTYIGWLKENINAILTRDNEAITRNIYKYDEEGSLYKSRVQGVISFCVVSTVGTSAQKQAQLAVEQSMHALDRMNIARLGREHEDATTVNRVVSVADVWTPLLDKIELFTQVVNQISEIHPYAKMAWSILSAAHKIVMAQKNRDENIMHLVETMNDIYNFVREASPLERIQSHKQIIAVMAQQTTECAHFIRSYCKNRTFWVRTIKHLASHVDDEIKRYEEQFKKLQSAFQGKANLETELVVLRILDSVEGLAAEIDLNDMPYAEGAWFDSDKGCLAGTREEIIQEISDWVNSDDDAVPRIFLLSGVAGSGKSAVSHTVAHRFNELRRLGSSFCFDRAEQATRRPNIAFSTIARDLADFDPERKRSLCRVIERRGIRTTRAVRDQLEKFILKPAADLVTVGPTVIVIDALDESGDQMSRKALLLALAEKAADLPSDFRILITARAERDIQEILGENQNVLYKSMGAISAGSTRRDISMFIHDQLAGVANLEHLWPNKSWCRLLVDKSEGLFQWAFTACQFVKGEGKGGQDPTERLDLILSPVAPGSQLNSLDQLYFNILTQIFDPANTTAMDRFRFIIGRVLAAREPLSVSALRHLCHVKSSIDLVGLIVRPMGSLLSGVAEEYVPVRPLHTSFRDFLTDKNRSRHFFIDLSLHHEGLALACLQIMKFGLRFNICELETSYIRNDSVPELTVRVEKAIPSHLRYSCRYWADHLHVLSVKPQITEDVRDFLNMRLLLWLEVLSLIKEVNVASKTLKSIVEWSQDNDIVAFAADARKFVAAFGSVIAQSAPHIYLSALTFAPTESQVSQKYLPNFSHVLRIESGKKTDWPAIQNVLEGHTRSVNSVAFSWDSKRIASGSDDKTVLVWDAETGDIASGPFKGHSGWISSVAFSPDGSRIASGSSDKTIYVWDADNGDIICGPFIGHTDWITSVAFSHDGKIIVSGSGDMTIRVWNAETGDIIAGPLEGHNKWVTCVTFSWDDLQIVSGSGDTTIQVWDVETCTISQSFEGHSGAVNSVGFSPDGNLIISGSSDKTIRLWNIQTGDIIARPFEGHTGPVRSVAFSHNGRYIVSASSDKTILVWNVDSGRVNSGPFVGHTEWITSVSFSYDDRRIVSGSYDRTIRVWDAETSDFVSPTFEGHTGPVNSVAFSHSGDRIVSGSDDSTVWVWDVETGGDILGPLQGHAGSVYSVAFSQDDTRIVSGSDDKTIWVWDANTGDVASGPFKGHSSWVSSVSFSPNGRRIASGSADKTVRVWDAETGDIVSGPFEGHTEIITSIAFSPDGKYIVSGSYDKTIRLWDAETGDIMLEPFEGHHNWITYVAFSPGGEHIVSGSQDQTIRVWDTKTGKNVVGPFNGHTDSITAVAYTPDGQSIVSGSLDKTIRIWDADTGNLIAGPFEGHSSWVSSGALSQDGERMASGSGDKTIRVWDVESNSISSQPVDDPVDLLSSSTFSRDDQHTVNSGNTFGKFPLHGFRSDSRLENGWILNSSSELLFWLPPWARTGLWWPTNTSVIAEVSTRVDFSQFVHGTCWQRCRQTIA